MLTVLNLVAVFYHVGCQAKGCGSKLRVFLGNGGPLHFDSAGYINCNGHTLVELGGGHALHAQSDLAAGLCDIERHTTDRDSWQQVRTSPHPHCQKRPGPMLVEVFNDVLEVSLTTLRYNIAREIGEANGLLSFEDANEWQNGGD